MSNKIMISSDDLKKECHSKIKVLEELLVSAESKQVLSKAREEYAQLIAVVLRTLTCKVSGTDGLINLCDYDKALLFPLYNPIEAFNLLTSYKLVFVVNQDGKTYLKVSDDIQDEEKVYCAYLSFKAWISEAVIDFKDSSFPPMSRYEIVRLIADQRGAHFQPDIDGRLYKITHEPILPMYYEGKYSTKNLFTETIIGIAKELVFSYRHFCDSIPQFLDKDGYVYIQEYTNNPKSYKYARTNVRINAYNSNHFYSCKVSEKLGKIYKIQFRDRLFDVAIISDDYLDAP